MQQFIHVLLYLLLSICSLFLICLILIQRGKGGGLAGAFGGAGGSSAFGTKAGDVFTRVTMVTASIWIALAMLLVVVSNSRTSAWGTSTTATGSKSDVVPPTPVPGKTGETLDLPPKDLPPPPKDEKAKSGEPAVPVSGGGPAAPLAPLEPSKPAPK